MATRLSSSFRDPSGFVFRSGEKLLRQINQSFEADWSELSRGSFLDQLIESGKITSFKPASLDLRLTDEAIAVIEIDPVPFVSYPYEWCFSQLRDAALLTLDLMSEAMDNGFWLKDASAYNVQFRGTQAEFIDTLSFERYREGEPWPAYGQFCRHFLAPLALMRYRGAAMGKLAATNVDGIDLSLASQLLPRATLLNFGLLTHIHVHGRSTTSSAASSAPVRVPKTAILGLIDSLKRTVTGLRPQTRNSTWRDYYSATNYSDTAAKAKSDLVREMLSKIRPLPQVVWDLGANTGVFSQIAAERSESVVAFDLDAEAVEAAYQALRKSSQTKILPLIQDFSNPSPSIGWNHAERDSLALRGPADVALALALVHHLAIGNNVPFSQIAGWMRQSSRWLIIEWVPKTDSQVQRMLATRRDVFADYERDSFIASFQAHFTLIYSEKVCGSEREIFLFGPVEATH